MLCVVPTCTCYVMLHTECCYRPGVFYTIKMDGCLDVWDYFYKQNDPTLQVRLICSPTNGENGSL